jgi:hypothetical protein
VHLFQGLDRVQDSGQNIVFNFISFSALWRLLVHAGDSSYLITQKSYLVDTEDILVPACGADAVLLGRDILVRNDRLDT